MNPLIRSKFVAVLAVGAISGVAAARDVVEVDLNRAAREYCHVLHFPSGWQAAKPPFLLVGDDYEFRVPGLQGTKFLIRGVQTIIDRYYTSNIYEADFSDPKGIALPATEAEWQSGTPVSVSGIISNYGVAVKDRSSNYAELEGRRFTRTGAAWGGTPLSPDRSVLILESWSGTGSLPRHPLRPGRRGRVVARRWSCSNDGVPVDLDILDRRAVIVRGDNDSASMRRKIVL
jgi:hypothetical protein